MASDAIPTIMGKANVIAMSPNEGNDIVRKHAYVPLTTVPIPLSATATINETGGIGIYGRLP